MKPDATTRYELKADGAETGALTISATVTVSPVITEFTSTPPVAKVGQKITLAWKTAGADAVSLTERTFGPIEVAAADVATGTVDFTVPDTLGGSDGGTTADGGMASSLPVPDGYPLEFTLTASTAMPMQATSKKLLGGVGDGPVIFEFNAPANATSGKPVTVSWRTNATRVEVLADGRLVFAPPAGTLATGSADFPAPTADTTITLVAYDFNGFSIRASKVVKIVQPPKVNTFTLPASLTTGGTAAAATWTTSNATSVVIRLKNGPTTYFTADTAKVAAGNASVYPAQTATYVLEAYNLAGAKDTLEKTVEVGAPVNVTVTPSLATVGTDIVVTWDVAAASPTDVAGVPAAVTRTSSSPDFVDIDGMTGTQKLAFLDDNDAVATIAPPNGFVFSRHGRSLQQLQRLDERLHLAQERRCAAGQRRPRHGHRGHPGAAGPLLGRSRRAVERPHRPRQRRVARRRLDLSPPVDRAVEQGAHRQRPAQPAHLSGAAV